LEQIKGYFRSMETVLRAMPNAEIEAAVELLLAAYQADRQVILVGNGGSAATASHFACDLSKGTCQPGHRPCRVIALTDNVPLLTAWANDVSYDEVFARQLDALVNPDDVLVAISGSGNSPNVLNAVRVARERGAVTIGLTGGSGGALRLLVDLCITIPTGEMSFIEDCHLMVAHLISRCFREETARAVPSAALGGMVPEHLQAGE
jgi:D-sedoheptulose 7-phosphate isomerase